MSRLLSLGGVAAALLLTASGSAQDVSVQKERLWNFPGWRTVAYRTISGGTDTDRIYLPGRARFSQARLCSMNAPIRMRDFDVHFINGQRQDVSVRERIAAGSCTRAIRLLGNYPRDITMIRLRYERFTRSMERPVIRLQVR